jgi:hypothetical protein
MIALAMITQTDQDGDAPKKGRFERDYDLARIHETTTMDRKFYNSQPCREYFALRPVLEGISARPQ